ncbi:MAG: hypothetical protein DVS81_00090 [Candidatus Accumulibacter meliphilus]|uniref:Uncharacterized protein n=1 Tax=Candidatus Accumulibacter meliphilus TaxID=2211374 RepID=A0A369XVM1_9PROT|nr:MAG: hypothetical protein DVS81_00090 [Candidatus Accumulibacter meliphilus]
MFRVVVEERGPARLATAKGRQTGQAECYYRRPILHPAGMLLVMSCAGARRHALAARLFSDFFQRG